MATTTKLHVSPETLEQLQELIQINIDSRDGFMYAASKLEDMAIAGLFGGLANERRIQADELSRLVEFNGEEPDRSGSFSAAVHRTWMGIRDGVSGASDYAVLAEAEQGEDTILDAYRDAVQCGCTGEIHDVLIRHCAAVQAAHDRVRDLRDARAE